jgi:class 3 adenylate cyclase
MRKVADTGSWSALLRPSRPAAMATTIQAIPPKVTVSQYAHQALKIGLLVDEMGRRLQRKVPQGPGATIRHGGLVFDVDAGSTIGHVPARTPLPSADEPHEGAAHLTGEQISEINRFPDDNPNPVMRIDADGHLIYANPASAGVLKALGVAVGDPLPEDVIARFEAVAPSRGFLEFVWDSRTFAVWPVPIRDLNFTNLYGMDVTAERAIVKFPDQNPNPVLRMTWDGALTYANPASAGLVAGLVLAIGAGLPADLRERLLENVRRADRTTVEVEAGGRTYALLAVDVPEFGFVNVYGTDITAVKEQGRLAHENERLLLNILPEPIAQRLRDGEPLIADRFDDVTLLFADIVEFTRLSASMSPAELVGVLNEVFTVFDRLVEVYDLEKVKTIGDAYMVVGGMAEPSSDHTMRVAAMALALAEAVDAIEAAARLGIRFRIGIHCGPVVAGVIGSKKFIYDVWGDTVNLASRMESLGVPGRVQVTHAVMERLTGTFELEARGLIDVKGKGPTPTYLLVAGPSQGPLASPRTRASDADGSVPRDEPRPLSPTAALPDREEGGPHA